MNQYCRNFTNFILLAHYLCVLYLFAAPNHVLALKFGRRLLYPDTPLLCLQFPSGVYLVGLCVARGHLSTSPISCHYLNVHANVSWCLSSRRSYFHTLTTFQGQGIKLSCPEGSAWYTCTPIKCNCIELSLTTATYSRCPIIPQVPFKVFQD